MALEVGLHPVFKGAYLGLRTASADSALVLFEKTQVSEERDSEWVKMECS